MNDHHTSRAGVYWIDMNGGGLVELGDAIEPLRQSGFNSFVGHEFEIHELPDLKTGLCGGGRTMECTAHRFKVNPDREQREWSVCWLYVWGILVLPVVWMENLFS